MTDPNSKENLEDFIRGMGEASQVIVDENPDVLIVPMVGSVPFIDVMNIIDDDFPNYKVEYVPASGSIEYLKQVLNQSFDSILEEYSNLSAEYKEPKDQKETYILSIDEVISGNSMIRGVKAFNGAKSRHATQRALEHLGMQRRDFANSEELKNYRNELEEKIKFKSIGIEQTHGENKKHPNYLSLREEGIIIPVKVNSIVTMDRHDMMPVKYKVSGSPSNVAYKAELEKIEQTKEYIELLQEVANYVGKGEQSINIRNITRINKGFGRVADKAKRGKYF